MVKMRLRYQGERMRLDRQVIIGRHRENQIRLNDPLASRQHAKVDLDEEGRAYVEDMDSANGTKVNGRPLEGRHLLVPGDRIVIGTSEIFYEEKGDRADAGVKGDAADRRAEDAPRPDAEPEAQAEPEPGAGPDSDALDEDCDPALREGISRLDDLIGLTLAGNRIKRLLIQDAFSALFAGTQVNLERPVAVRVFHPDIIRADSDLADKALAISRRAGQINSEFLGKVHRCGIACGMLWFSMEMVSGRHLEEIVEEKGPLEPLMALLVLERIALGLKEAHAHDVFHGDLRPRSIMINETGLVKVTNLGLVPVQYELQPDGTKSALGNPLYSDPVLATGRPLDAQADVYSLGCVFHYVLTGEAPFSAATPERILDKHREEPLPDLRKERPELPTGFNHLLHGMMAKNRAWRYASAQELLDEIVAVRDGLLEDDGEGAEAEKPDDAPARPPPQPSARRRRRSTAAEAAGATDPVEEEIVARRRGANRLLGALVFLLVVAGAFFLLQQVGLSGYIYGTTYADEVPADPEWRDHGVRLAFDAPDDLERIESRLDASHLVGGELVAPDQRETTIRCTHPFGGRDWTVRVELSIHQRRGRTPRFAVVVADDGRSRVRLELEGQTLVATVADAREAARHRLSTGALANLDLRVTCRDCRIAVHAAGQRLLSPQRVTPFARGELTVTGAGADWALREIAITGRVR